MYVVVLVSTTNSNIQWFCCLMEFLQAIQRKSASLCCNPSNHKLELHTKCQIPYSSLGILSHYFIFYDTSSEYKAVQLISLSSCYLILSYPYLESRYGSPIMYLTFIVCTGKMRIKNSYVLRGLRHPLGEIIMNEYE